MPNVIVVTGASSGFGTLTVRALADAGNTVCAGIRETAGRNPPAVAGLGQYAGDHGVDLRALKLDVVSDSSVTAAVGWIIGESRAASTSSSTTPGTWRPVR